MENRFQIEQSPLDGGGAQLRIVGDAGFDEAEAFGRALNQAAANPGGRMLIDLAEAERLDGSAAAMVYGLRRVLRQRGVDVEIIGARGDVAAIMDLYDDAAAQGSLREGEQQLGAIEQVGEVASGFVGGIGGILEFVGAVTASALNAVRHPRSIHWADLTKLMERAGADALPIVALIAFLIGLVTAFQAAGTLAQYGANVYIADMVGLSMTRIMGPLMMAILVAGRSGAGFSAELGTMKVSEEIDALSVLGLDPVRFLVIPRVLALVLMVPLLTLMADLVGVIGGGIIGVTFLDLTPVAFINRLHQAIGLWDIGTGLLLSIAYGVAIGMIACERGLATRGGAEGVGRYTTSAVVTILFHLVLISAVFTIIFQFWGI